MLESRSDSECNYWEKRELNINTDFAVNGWMLCVIPHIRKYASVSSYGDHMKHINNVIKRCLMDYIRMKCMLT